MQLYTNKLENLVGINKFLDAEPTKIEPWRNRKSEKIDSEWQDLIDNKKSSQARWLTPVILALWEAEVSRSWGQEFKTSLTHVVNPISTKNTKISQAWWCVPIIPATWEAEAGESLEPGGQRLQWAKIMPLHSSLSKTPSQKKEPWGGGKHGS